MVLSQKLRRSVMRLKSLLLGVLVLAALGLMGGLGFSQEKPLVIATTSILADFAEAVGGDLIEVYTIAPSGICPAHYDVSPGDLRAVAQASLVLYQGIEPWLEGLIVNSGNPDVKKVPVQGTYQIPQEACRMVEEIAEALAEVIPDDAEYFEENSQAYQAKILSLAEELQAEAAELAVNAVNVITIRWQQEFVDLLGFNIVATYPSPEMVSLKEFSELVRIGHEEQVALVVHNLQSGGNDFATRLAFAVGAVPVILTNFPGVVPHTSTYLEMVRYNADQLFAALRTYRGE
jgi:ABC-type Zn uptake system ZnuABC Zn-binding protein ZnuA